jgi:hypothetical protein
MTAKEEWDQLLGCPGWLRLCQKSADYWTGQIAAHLSFATNDRDDVAALNKLRQILAAKQAVEALLQLPHEELRAIEAQTAKALPPEHRAEVFSRRGGL